MTRFGRGAMGSHDGPRGRRLAEGTQGAGAMLGARVRPRRRPALPPCACRPLRRPLKSGLLPASREARRLVHARAARRVIGPFPPADAPADEAQGAAAQLALHRRTAAPLAGFKIGATGKRMQEFLGLSGPAAGFMPAPGVHSGSATLRFADFIRPGVECELVVRLARDLPPGPCTQQQAAEAIAA